MQRKLRAASERVSRRRNGVDNSFLGEVFSPPLQPPYYSFHHHGSTLPRRWSHSPSSREPDRRQTTTTGHGVSSLNDNDPRQINLTQHHSSASPLLEEKHATLHRGRVDNPTRTQPSDRFSRFCSTPTPDRGVLVASGVTPADRDQREVNHVGPAFGRVGWSVFQKFLGQFFHDVG